MPQLKKALAEEDPGSGFFEGCLRKGRGSAPGQYRLWRNGIWEAIREMMPTQSSLGSRADVPAGRRSAAPDSIVSSNPAIPAKKRWKCATPSSRSSLEHRRRYGYRRVDGRTPPPRHGRQPQARAAADARRQPAGRRAESLRRHHRVGPRPAGLPEPGQAHEADRHQPVMGGRHHLHPAGAGVRLPGRGAGCVLAQSGRLGAGPHPDRAPAAAGSGARHRPAPTRARPGAPLRSRRAVCLRAVHAHARRSTASCPA